MNYKDKRFIYLMKKINYHFFHCPFCRNKIHKKNFIGEYCSNCGGKIITFEIKNSLKDKQINNTDKGEEPVKV